MKNDRAGKKHKVLKGSLSKQQNVENLEISSTGYGFESVPQNTERTDRIGK